MKLIKSLIIIIVCLGLTGCGGVSANLRALEDLQLIRTLGVDAAPMGIVLSATSGKPEGAGEPVILRRQAAGLLAGMETAQQYAARGQLFFAHTRYLLLGEDYARRGIDDVLDFVARDTDIRMGTALFYLRGSAAALITAPEDESYDVTELLASVQRDTQLRCDSHVFSVRETAVALSEQGAALVCALTPVDPEGSVFPDAPKQTAVTDGYGILRHARLVGELRSYDAAAASLLCGVPGRLQRTVSDGDGGTVTLEYGGSAALRAGFLPGGGVAPVDVRVRLSAVAAEVDSPGAPVTDPAFLAALADRLSAAVAENVRSVLETSAALDADFLGLGPRLRLADGAAFAALPEGWLKTLEFHVSVETEIDHSYDLGDSPGTDGGAGA